MRFTLKYLLAGVAFVGFGCVALYNANEAWVAATRTSTLLVLLASIVGAIYSQPRASYVGMCIFGWGYLLLNNIRIGPTPLLGTGGLLAVFLDHIQRTIPSQEVVGSPV